MSVPHTFRFYAFLQAMETKLKKIKRRDDLSEFSCIASVYVTGFFGTVTQRDAIPCNATDTLPFRPQAAPHE